MKYGQNFEHESVPEWSLHNIDYNSLKHHIKVHTTRDQASAIAIPGHQDNALSKFEDELFLELCRQHDRVDLFVSSKADELSRRLQYLSNQIQLLLARCARRSRDSPSPKRQRRFLKYEQELQRCDDDIQALARFVKAQVVAFRKILKKYRKWTGSATLGSRFRDTVLSHPKGFTRRDFSYLQSQCDSLLATLRAAAPADVNGVATPPSLREQHMEISSADPSHQQSDSHLQLPNPAVPQHQGYWNEYDNGSEGYNTNDDGTYAIYINPEDSTFPGTSALAALLRAPLEKTRMWLASQQDRRHGTGSAAFTTDSNANNAQTLSRDISRPLLPRNTTTYGGTDVLRFGLTSPTINGDSSYVPSPLFQGPSSLTTDTEGERPPARRPRPKRRSSSPWSDDYAFPPGYAATYAAPSPLLLPSIESQRALARYRDRVLVLGTAGAFAASFVLLAVAAVLILTGRHRLRAEVDAGVVVGVCASLACACAALGMDMHRVASKGWGNWVLVGGAFTAACFLNGALLVLVVGNSPI